MKFIGDDREEEEEFTTWIVSMLKNAFVLLQYTQQNYSILIGWEQYN